MSNGIGEGYAGDVAPRTAWEALAGPSRAVLIDVRTRAEWSFVGLPSLADLGKQPITLEWQVFPSMTVNADFVEVLDRALDQAGFERDTPLYFLCRSGARSRHAAIAMTGAGWTRCFNVATGFEGPLDTSGHRGGVSGWKADGLPWTQS
ncbi:MAG: rhodanese-like domain-containing protein [Siculibacillus sp.]